ncbi:MAG: ABC transporter permease [Lachnospiraceae bacterium]|nr:ABC transporter permease [Lachnospiraceae bacterium]
MSNETITVIDGDQKDAGWLSIPREIIANKKLIMGLAKNDFRQKFAGSYLGVVWAFVQPVVTVFVYWFVFTKALPVGTSMMRNGIEYPYVIWLLCGLVPWFFFSEVINSGTTALTDYDYLVKKVVFKVSILPAIKEVSSTFVHLFFVGFTLLFCVFYKNYPSVYSLQLVYYFICMVLLSLGIIYATSAITVFFKDMKQVVNIGLQVLIWMTPIMWDISNMKSLNPIIVTILKLNPMFYIVQGYRESLLDKVWFFSHGAMTLYFWIVTLLIFFVGTRIFNKLKVHFADIL